MRVDPVSAVRPRPPDADWEAVRARVMAAIATDRTTWTDHNAVDPGVTIAEVLAFGVADLHYRTASRPSTWPVEVPAWLSPDERHWHATLPVGTTKPLADKLAGAMAPGAASRAAVLEPLIRRCADPGDARALLARAPWANVFTTDETPVVLALLRARLVRQVAQERTDLIAQALDDERAAGGTVHERDARAAGALGRDLRLWPEELLAVVRRERRRRTAQVVVDHLDAIVAATSGPAATAVRAALAAADLAADEVDVAMGYARVPLAVVPPHSAPAESFAKPEDFEDTDGSSRVWPPHPIQALTCEPVTADDYARRARAHPGVTRAWAIPGRLVGVGWDGREVGESAEVDEANPAVRAGTITLVVESEAGLAPGTEAAFLRDVLRTAIGDEVDEPHPSWPEGRDDPRPHRMICDEVGGALLRLCPVVVVGRVMTGADTDPAVVITGVRTRLAAYFAGGRPESRPTPVAEPSVSGPWPRIDQPAEGWVPGEPIHFSEVAQVISRDPSIIGVESLSIGVGSASPIPSSYELVTLDPGCVPTLGATHLRVRFAPGGCSDA